MTKLDDILTALAHPARRQALRLIDENGEICLCEILAEVGIAQPNMSRHMGMLLRAGVVLDRRDGRRVLYRRDPSLGTDLLGVVDAVLNATEALSTKAENREMAA